MKAYVGQTRAKATIRLLEEAGVGECTSPSELPPRRFSWFFDNGAYPAHKKGLPFPEEEYLLALQRLPSLPPPHFLVVPDIVAGGLESLAFSLSWVPRLRGIAPLYLAVQNGQVEDDIRPHLSLFDGIFVGGDLSWKMKTSPAWVGFAHDHGKLCHIGRVGPIKRLLWARRIGADSIDSCFPLWTKDRLKKFLFALEDRQPSLASW